jgi:hypothetical protein
MNAPCRENGFLFSSLAVQSPHFLFLWPGGVKDEGLILGLRPAMSEREGDFVPASVAKGKENDQSAVDRSWRRIAGSMT